MSATADSPPSPPAEPVLRAAGEQTDHHAGASKKLVILGSTGSIGVNTLNVVEHLNTQGLASIDVVGLAAGSNAALLAEQAERFDVKHVAIADSAQAALSHALPNTKVLHGEDAPLQLIEQCDATDVSAAVVGSAGLPATVAAIERGLRIGLANKETLVAAGALVTPLVEEHGATLIPVDSEHSAIFQCLEGIRGSSHRAIEEDVGEGMEAQGRGGAKGLKNSIPRSLDDSMASQVKRIVLTASGGPFREASKDTIENATVEQALNHPTWDMGPKITIDSATMMNKALEIIEAHWLFGLPAEKIDVIIHPQSIAHSFVEFADNSVLAQLGPPDMRTPIQYALTYPDRPAGCSEALDWSKLSRLAFEQPDFELFPALGLAYDVIRAGGTAGAVFNAANEAAVAAFLERRVRFGRIVELVAAALDAVDHQPADSLETLWQADRQARAFVASQVH